jgi:predicted aldo/keto reductase-like oxidoreductase
MRLDKYLKVSRLIKRRTVANEACDAGRVSINDKPAKASSTVKVGDVIEIQFGTRTVKVEVTSIAETVKKDEAKDLFNNARPNMSVASWALRYCASFPNVKVILSGMSNLEQLQDNINTFTNYEELNENDKLTIEKAKKAILGNNFVPCTGCKYCMPCPMGINIPRTFAIYNVYGINKDINRFNAALKNNPVELDVCVKCGACVEQCPQRIDIPTRLEDVNKIYKA